MLRIGEHSHNVQLAQLRGWNEGGGIQAFHINNYQERRSAGHGMSRYGVTRLEGTWFESAHAGLWRRLLLKAVSKLALALNQPSSVLGTNKQLKGFPEFIKDSFQEQSVYPR